MAFIFDRCRRRWSVVVTPVKYTCDSNNLEGTFATSKFSLKEKLTNGALVPPSPGASHKNYTAECKPAIRGDTKPHHNEDVNTGISYADIF